MGTKMKKKGRKEVFWRLIDPNRYAIGYWDGNTGDSGKDFRCFGFRQSREAAEKLVDSVVKESPHLYYHLQRA